MDLKCSEMSLDQIAFIIVAVSANSAAVKGPNG